MPQEFLTVAISVGWHRLFGGISPGLTGRIFFVLFGLSSLNKKEKVHHAQTHHSFSFWTSSLPLKANVKLLYLYFLKDNSQSELRDFSNKIGGDATWALYYFFFVIVHIRLFALLSLTPTNNRTTNIKVKFLTDSPSIFIFFSLFLFLKLLFFAFPFIQL